MMGYLILAITWFATGLLVACIIVATAKNMKGDARKYYLFMTFAALILFSGIEVRKKIRYDFNHEYHLVGLYAAFLLGLALKIQRCD